MNSTTNKLDWTKQTFGRLPRFASVAYWCVIAFIASGSVLLIWPEPYEFRVSQTTFQAVEKIDGEFVPLDDYQTGYKKLAVFERKCRLVSWFSGAIGACVAHLIASLLTGRDVSVSVSVISIPLIMIGMWIAAATVPETVDPVYGDGFKISLPFWVYMLVFIFGAIVATVIEFCLLAVRWVMGKYVFNAC